MFHVLILLALCRHPESETAIDSVFIGDTVVSFSFLEFEKFLEAFVPSITSGTSSVVIGIGRVAFFCDNRAQEDGGKISLVILMRTRDLL